MTTRHPRRTFLERLSLGAGAALLGPIAGTLYNEALGQPLARKRVVFFMTGNGITDYCFTPPEFKSAPGVEGPSVVEGSKAYTLPPMVKALEPWRNRMLMVEGLQNTLRGDGQIGNHSGLYNALSCIGPVLGGSTKEVPGAITIDQFIANKIGDSTTRRSVLVGFGGQNGGGTGALTKSKVFAFDKDKPAPFFQEPKSLFDDLFAGSTATGDGGAGAARRRVLLDSIRFDIKRLQGAFAGTERGKLDAYLSQIADIETRDGAGAALSCSPVGPKAMPVSDRDIEDRLTSLVDIATTSLACGLTNVVGITNCNGTAHTYFPTWTKVCAGTSVAPFNGDIGHAGADRQGPAMSLFHNFNAGLIARMATSLSAIKEGNGTVFDNTVIVYMSDNADGHHADYKHWPLLVIGGAGGKIRADGRFLRFPKRGAAGYRSMADFFCTIATAVGAPTDSFGKGGFEPVKGPISELLA